MRYCKVCSRFFRANDPGGTVDVPPDNKHGVSQGQYAACSECCSEYETGTQYAGYCLTFGLGSEPVQSGVSPGEYGVTSGNGVYDQVGPGLCGMCRRYARENDNMEAIRVYREDLEAGDPVGKLIPAHEPQGCFMACQECRLKYRPAIFKRLKTAGLVRPEMRVEQFNGAWML